MWKAIWWKNLRVNTERSNRHLLPPIPLAIAMDCRVVHSVLLAMTKCELQSLNSLHGKNTTLVIARAESPWRSTGPNCPNRQPRPHPPRHDGLARPSLRSLLAMTNTTHPQHPCHREPLAGVAIHWSSLPEQTNPPASSETRWIAVSVTCVPSSQ